jgi:Timeless protein.
VERDEDTGLVIERILILVRNVLQVPADPEAEKRTDNDASIHDQVMLQMFMEHGFLNNDKERYIALIYNWFACRCFGLFSSLE